MRQQQYVSFPEHRREVVEARNRRPAAVGGAYAVIFDDGEQGEPALGTG